MSKIDSIDAAFKEKEKVELAWARWETEFRAILAKQAHVRDTESRTA